MRSAERARIGRYRVEWDAEHLKVTMAGSRWGGALLAGGLLGGGITLLILSSWFMGWKDGWKAALFGVPLIFLFGGMGYANGKAFEEFAVEAFLTGSRAVWIRIGAPVTVPAGDILQFQTSIRKTGEARYFGVELRTEKQAYKLMPGGVSVPKPYCDAIAALLNAVVLKNGAIPEALALAEGVESKDRWAIAILSLIIAAIGIFLVLYFKGR